MPTGLQRNNDPNQRPSNRSLRFRAGFGAVFWALLLGVGFTLGYVYLSNLIVGRPYGVLSVLFFVAGCGLGLAWYLREHFKAARLKREEFVRAGGDPTGITPWMFGAMSGKIPRTVSGSGTARPDPAENPAPCKTFGRNGLRGRVFA
jgi:hypothetical protein